MKDAITKISCRSILLLLAFAVSANIADIPHACKYNLANIPVVEKPDGSAIVDAQNRLRIKPYLPGIVSAHIFPGAGLSVSACVCNHIAYAGPESFFFAASSQRGPPLKILS